ncbi:hypothetical protein A8B84_10345 [Marinobacter sp. EhC06]|jgi:hypothetical protein|uniref:hypothetical protein n=1 Tax=Marinobacter TaxID=2742 RepID=UPI0007D93ECD|nr:MULTISPECIES: hypothetical protein [unclassified Marinobacter]OAN88969.1 hypothetical protein A8B80_08550 [Marinobacter sp. EhN04]OAN91952.1 hypothetical protein A8B84_10345 [Marinobacter sp. EhC06]
MLEHNSPRTSAPDRLLNLAVRLIEARQPENDAQIPDELVTDRLIQGLIEIATISPYTLNAIPIPDSETKKRRAIEAVRTLIGALLQGGLPKEKAYQFFSLKDLNLLFYIHSQLVGADDYLNIPFQASTGKGQ